MPTTFHVRVDIPTPHTNDLARKLGAADRSDSVSRAPDGTVVLNLHVEARGPATALTKGFAAARAAAGVSPSGGEVLTLEQHQARQGVVPLPDLVGLAEAAEILGTSKQAVQERIRYGSLRPIPISAKNVALLRSEVVPPPSPTGGRRRVEHVAGGA